MTLVSNAAVNMPLLTTDAAHYTKGMAGKAGLSVLNSALSKTGLGTADIEAALEKAGVKGADIADIARKLGADTVADGSGRGDANFADVMLRAIDQVSAQHIEAENLSELALVEPDAVDAADITIAQAKASLSLNIAATVLNRLVSDWKEIINLR